MQGKRTAPKFKRGGLHKLECGRCDGYGYFTVAQLEAKGLPSCWCGQVMQPDRLELALLLGADDAPIMSAYRTKVNSVAKGQQSHIRRGNVCESPEFRAIESISAEQRREARRRRVAAILPTPEPMPF